MKCCAAQALIMMLVLGLAAKASGQTAQELADEALRRTVPPTGLLTDPTMQDVVVPYQTANPEASSVNQYNIEDRAFQAQNQNTGEARAYGAMKDSAVTRPSVSLGSDPLSLADDAVAQGPSVIGGIFTANEGSCSEIFQGGKYNGFQLCTRILARRKDVCTENRAVSVDREDQWRCAVENGTYKKLCDQAVSWSCTGNTGHSCIQSAVSFSTPVIWTDLSGAGSGSSWARAAVNIPARGGGSCALHRDYFTITTRDWASLHSLLVTHQYFHGVAQIRVNGVNLWTFGTANTGNIYIGNRECGKDCNVPAVYSAGGAWIADCGNAAHSIFMNTNVFSVFAPPVAGPTTFNGAQPILELGKSETVHVEILRANTNDAGGTVTFQKHYGCCSAITATVGGNCQ